ncbi:type IV pilus modification PilV family protein [Clostridium diolis]|uniref:Prepilin-type N-terminal cleavage/methylation domain-containing protein n=1 Tax=Clostridium diolis TaxID=223919 RepID=A0AAV3VU19_9CLOT|nr:prepilin-type N-terminal cleavage/methylation domain-containing protein [Clostridium diolis]GEA29219.1 hypothetical protein CDIOL_01420 [Clostridium diolis]
MKIKLKKHRGFTLIEMIISLALFAILMTPIYSMVILTMKQNNDGGTKQTASLKGQELFEKIKSGDIVPVEDNSGNITAIKIGDKVIQVTSNKIIDDLGDGYKAKIEIQKNSSVNLNKETTTIRTNNFNISLSGNNNPVKIKSDNENGELNYNNSDDTLELVINTKTGVNSKLLDIKDKYNNIILQDGCFNLNDTDNGSPIKLILNFDEYKVLNASNSNKLKNVDITVYNQDSMPLNLCLQKSNDLNVNIDAKLGNVRVYDNRTKSDSKLGGLYDIDIVVTQTIEGETKTIFTSRTSQNINQN